ncbi:PQQ-binding-like beta-propeller repeat protein [Spirillospora sp. NPDC127200]
MPPLEPGDPPEIGGYRLLKRLGAGGMGLVFLGRSPAGLLVAIKVVHARFADDPQFRARFRREVTTAKAVSGAFTAPVIDADPEAASPWLVTTFLPGRPLNEAVADHGPLPAPAVAGLGAGLAEALVSIHRAGIVHRDLKPHNVMLTPDGPRVIDFGIAHAADISAITRAGAVVGSPGYMSPEQARGRETGPAGDVFSLGAVLAFAATGEGPFGRAQMQVMVYRVVHEEPRLDGIDDPRLRQVVAACLAKDPAHRPTPPQILEWLGTAPQGVAWLPAPMAEDVAEQATLVPRERRTGRRAFLVAASVTAGVPLAAAGAYAATFYLRRAGAEEQVPKAEPIWRLAMGTPIPAAPAVAGDRLLAGDAKGRLHVAVVGGREVDRYLAGAPLNAPPVVGGRLAFVISADGVLHAVEAATGKGRWRRPLGKGARETPAVGAGLVHATDAAGRVRAFDAADGRPRWVSPPFRDATAPVVIGTAVHVHGNGAVQVLDAATGKARAPIAQPYGDGLTAFGALLVGGRFQTGDLWCHDTARRAQAWTYKSSKPFRAPPALAGNRAYLGDTAGYLTALDTGGGTAERLWRFRARGAIKTAPVAADGMVVVAADGLLHGVDDRGKARWRHDTGDSAGGAGPAVADGTVYTADVHGTVQAVRISG